MKNFYRGGRGLTFFTNRIPANSVDLRSTSVRHLARPGSEKIRNLFDLCSAAVREVFGNCSAIAEAEPNNTRRNPEPVPRQPRSRLEAEPKNHRTASEGMPITSDIRNTQETVKDDTRNVRLMYRECTVSVRGVYRKGTREVLESYWRPTKDPLNACTSGVDQRYSKSRRMVAATTNKSMPFVLALICFSRRLFSLMALKNIRILCLGFLCFMLFNLSDAWAQSPENGETAEGQSEIKPLQIGDTIPEDLWHMPLQVVNHPDGKDTITLNDYRDKKLIILDFWATWCGNCIKEFPKLQTLQQEFKRDGKFILATPQGSEAESYLSEKAVDLFSVVQTRETLSKYFPHLFIPYYVWIGNGKVVATTQPTEVNAENIETYIGQRVPPKRVRQDRVEFNLHDKFVNDSSIMRESVLKTAFVISGILQDVTRQTNYHLSTAGSPSFYAATNIDIKGLYESIIAIDRSDLRNPHRFIYETKWEEKIKNAFREYYHLDSADHIYSIQYFGFDKDKATLRKQVLSQVNRFMNERYGIRGVVEQRPVKAYVLTKVGTEKSEQLLKDMLETKVYKLVSLLDLQNQRRGLSVPWIDKTGNSMQSIYFPDEIPSDLAKINGILEPQGYLAEEEIIILDVFVIKDII